MSLDLFLLEKAIETAPRIPIRTIAVEVADLEKLVAVARAAEMALAFPCDHGAGVEAHRRLRVALDEAGL